MTQLSPAAQAIWEAYSAAFDEVGVFTNCDDLATALRALADQLHMKEPLGETDADAGVCAAHHAIHAQILAITVELECNHD